MACSKVHQGGTIDRVNPGGKVQGESPVKFSSLCIHKSFGELLGKGL